MTEKRNSFLKGAIILTAAGFLVKILGAVYRIPLAMMIKDEGMGLYQMAYPIYVTLLSVSTAGLPTAISKMVAGDVAVKRYRNAHRVFKVSLVVLTLVGAVLTVFLMLSARVLSEKVLGNPKAFYPLISISPAIFFVSIMSSFRGFFQGLQDMTPSAVSQVIEQVGRVVTVFVLATLLLPRGVEYAAAGAAFGPVVGSLAGLLLLMAVYRRRKRDLFDSLRAGSDAVLENPVHIAWRLFAFAIPITLGGLIIPVMNLADAAIVTRRLQDAGFSVIRATELYGQLTGMAAPLINLPAVMTMSMAASLVPAVSEAVALKNARMVAARAETGVRVTFIFALPAAMGLFVLAEPVSVLLYKNPQAGIPLSILSWGIIFLALQQTTTGLLQGVGKTAIPVRNLAVGAVFKVFINYTLTAVPGINIKGAALGTVVGYLVSSLLNFVSAMKWTGMALDLNRMIVKPSLATAVMGGAVYYCYEAMRAAGAGNSAATLASVGLGAFIYPLLLLAAGGLGEEELSLIPGGSRIIRWLQKMGAIRR
ncbi:putative polysaccharide biosynthesis protein [Thermosediminibacter litoriperuensis]|uniref:Stage V sporulation protein B n=1 Tax=Thermosediminibacter litoriperuensis TaxID=291989 RepID=A0A5S5AM09_9FIRM|nr:polysaccharide biosynthesis protein [Thermosediminibacter litoriperuensis]TYP50868.1 stage V sporulation protein B [Thermosediminibacter litoriperuensis]